MANEFETINSYAGWITTPSVRKVTNDAPTPQAAGLLIQAYAKSQGLNAQDVEFYVVKETTTFTPLTKTVFTVTTTTTPIGA